MADTTNTLPDTSNLGFGGNPYLGQNNPYLQGTIDQSLGDMTRNYNNVVQPQFNSAAVNSGSFGNEGINQANLASQKQLQESMGQQANNMRAQDYQNQQGMYQWQQNFGAQNQNIAFNQNQQNLQTAMGLLGMANGYNNQDLANGNAIQNAPLNYYGQFANTANSIGQGYGTQTGTSSAPGSPIMGALGGYQLGTALSNQFSSNSGGGSIGNYGYNTNYQYSPSSSGSFGNTGYI